MDYKIEVSDDAVVVHATCLLNQNIRRRILVDIASLMNQLTVSKALIDLTEATFNPDEPMSGALELTTLMRSLGIKPRAKLAFIYSDAESHRKYFEQVAQLDGFNLRYFKDRDSAVAWLKQDV